MRVSVKKGVIFTIHESDRDVIFVSDRDISFVNVSIVTGAEHTFEVTRVTKDVNEIVIFFENDVFREFA